ncbi:stage III sporulation protein AE [Lachnospiraceae bacterium NSJ-143]|nr:stage III sporulation protein AE [Lachnospiraceae bacterium NSJ-143]
MNMNLFIRRIIKAAVIFIALMAVCPYSVRAESRQNYEAGDFLDFDSSAADRAADNPYGLSVKGLAKDFMNGDFSFRDILDKVTGNFISDIGAQFGSMKKIIALIIVCGLLKSISSSFGGKSVNDLCFFVCYSVIIYIIMSSFIEETAIVKDNIKRFTQINAAMVPVYAAVSVMTEKALSSAALSATVIGFSALVSGFLTSVFVPVITAAAGLEMVNNIFDEDMFSSLAGFIKYALSMSLKVLGMAFVTVISFQRLGTGAASAFAVKAAKNAVNCVPVVGDILANSAQTVAEAGAAVGNAVAASCAVLAVVLSCAPVLRLAAVFIAFKVTAAITEPAGEKRITKTLNSAGDYFAILIGAVFLSAMMFTFSAVILAASF